MIYVEEKSYARQIALVEHIANLTNCLFCAWLYPESSVNVLAGLSILDKPEGLEPVTTYQDGTLPRRTELAPVRALAIHEAEFRKNCDALALYRVGEKNWIAITIGHEGMCLVREHTWINPLLSAGFNARGEAPGWW